MWKKLILILIISVPAHSISSTDLKLGEVQIKTINPEQRSSIETGYNFLHNFIFEQAEQKFTAELPAPWAYLGLMATQHKSMWHKTNFKAGKAISIEIQKSKLLAKVKNQPIHDLLTAYMNFFNSKNHKQLTKDLHTAYKKYPDNPETAAFYGLSLMTDSEDRIEARKVLSKGITKWPNHPGLLHYFIHASDIDDKKIVTKALDIAKHYASITPDAAHGLHMPSHLYVRLGMWQESAAANLASKSAAEHICMILKQDKMCDLENRLHAIEWLHFSYIQAKNDQKAINILDEMQTIAAKHPVKESLRVLKAMQARSILYQITPIVAIGEFSKDKLSYWQIYSETSLLIAQGIHLAKTDTLAANKAIEQLQYLLRNNPKAKPGMLAFIRLGIAHIKSALLVQKQEYKKAIKLLNKSSKYEALIKSPGLGYLTTAEHLANIYRIQKDQRFKSATEKYLKKQPNKREFRYD